MENFELMKKISPNNAQHSPDNSGLENEKRKNLEELAAEANRDVGELKKQPAKKNIDANDEKHLKSGESK